MLGHKSIELHRALGELVNSLGIDWLLILADPAEADAMAAGASGIPHQLFANHETLTRHLEQMIQPGDRILFKASRSVAMDQVVAPLRPDHSR